MDIFSKFNRTDYDSTLQHELKMSGLTPYDYADGKGFFKKLAVTFCVVATLFGWMTIFGLALVLK